MQNNLLPALRPSVYRSDSDQSKRLENAATPASGPAAPVRLNGDVARRRAGPTETILWDSELTGFGLRFLPSGRKTWIVRYVGRGVRKRLTLGVVGELDAETARGKARVILAAVATDGLPRPVVTGEAPSFAEYAEAFWSDNARHWKPKTQTTNKRLIERELKPVFGGLTVDRIRRADVLRWRDSFSERQGVFNRALPVLAAMLKYAELLGHRPRGSNPCRRTPRYKRAMKERYLSPAEYHRLGAILATVEADQPVTVAVIRLLLLTGARVSEILTLRWESIQPPRLQLPDSKSGPKFIYLGANAIAILEGLERCEACPWVFPAGKGEGPLTSIFPQWAKIRRAAAIPDVRIHDLRHSYASVAINRGMSLLLIGRLLDHAQPETTARYAHLEDRSIADAAMRVSQSLGQALGVLPGFGLRRYLSGRQAYVVQTRMGGRQRMVTLGSIALLTEFEARRLARQVLVRAHTGGNPAEDRTTALASPEFAAFLEEYWLRSEPRWKPTTQRTQGVYRRRYLDGAFDGQYVDQITQADVLKWFNRTTDTAGPGGANRVYAILNALFVRAEAWGHRPEGSNPCSGIRLNRRRKMERFLSVQELRRLGEALEAERMAHPIRTAAVMLILFTSCRSSEILGLHWSDVRGQKLQLRDSKTGPRVVWMGAEGRAVLDSLPRRRGIDWVFYNPVTCRPFGRLDSYWAWIRERTGFSTLRLHDLRHTYASHAAALSETLPTIGKLLGHSEVRSTAIYTHLDDGDVLRGAEELDCAISIMMGGGTCAL